MHIEPKEKSPNFRFNKQKDKNMQKRVDKEELIC